MKTKFKVYYPLTGEQKKDIFNNNDTFFIFDTNALLDVYRLGRTVSKKVIKLLKKYETQIKVPYHVAEEYHQHIYDIMIECDNLYTNLSKKITSDYIVNLIEKEDKNAFKYEHLRKMLKKHVHEALKVFNQKIKAEKTFISKQLESWDLPNELADFLGDKLLNKLSDEELRNIEDDWGRRCELKLPPGYGDSKKTNGNKCGDLIIWNEILKFAKEHPNNSIVFISRDINKGDWQWELHGRKCGLHPYLLNEFQNVSSGNILMYPLQEFINYANETRKVFNESEINSIQEIQLPDSSHIETYSRLQGITNAITLDDFNLDQSENPISSIIRQVADPAKKTKEVSSLLEENKL